MTPRLRCTVRGCERPLETEGATLRCSGGHTFDRAREGYWNLLQPQDRRSLRSGDRDEAVDARRRWLARGHVDGLVASLSRAIDQRELPQPATAIDVGCGEGTLTQRLLGSRGLAACGVDLSVKAIRLAARRDPGITWIVANADRGLPFPDGSVALALSIFGRRPASELSRVLAPGGRLLAVLPAEDDLIELREATLGSAVRRDRVEAALEELGGSFELVSRSVWRQRVGHDREALGDALAMSYRGARGGQRARLGAIAGLDVTLAAEILDLVPRGGLR